MILVEKMSIFTLEEWKKLPDHSRLAQAVPRITQKGLVEKFVELIAEEEEHEARMRLR